MQWAPGKLLISDLPAKWPHLFVTRSSIAMAVAGVMLNKLE